MSSNTDKAPRPGPWLTGRRCRSELPCCQPWFDSTEHVNQRTLDLNVSFAPFSLLTVFWKSLVCGTCVATLTCEFLDAKNPTFQLAYVAQWANVANSLYTLGSVLNTLLAAAATTPPPQPPDTATAGFFIRFTWVLFELAVHLGAGAMLLFWYFLFDPEVQLASYYALASHGGLWVLILLDGLVVNRIPLRWMHYFGIILPVEASYGAWTYVQYATQIGNPDMNGDDDAIYPGGLQWGGGEDALVYNVVIVYVIVVGPILFGVFWCIANGDLCCRDRRRYLDHHHDDIPSPVADIVKHTGDDEDDDDDNLSNSVDDDDISDGGRTAVVFFSGSRRSRLPVVSEFPSSSSSSSSSSSTSSPQQWPRRTNV